MVTKEDLGNYPDPHHMLGKYLNSGYIGYYKNNPTSGQLLLFFADLAPASVSPDPLHDFAAPECDS